MPDSFFVPVAERYLTVEGVASPKAIDIVSKGLPQSWPKNSILLFLSYANWEFPVGYKLDFVFDLDVPQGHVVTAGRISAVTQQFSRPSEAIPRGWKTISLIEFSSGIPANIQKLPQLDEWSGKPSLGLASTGTWSLLVEPPGTERWTYEELWRSTPLKPQVGYFTCPHCRKYVDAGGRWAYWNLQEPGFVSLEAQVNIAEVLQVKAYWSFNSSGDRMGQLLAESLQTVQKFIEQHKHHQLFYQEWSEAKKYNDFASG